MASEAIEYISTVDVLCRAEFSNILDHMRSGMPFWISECTSHTAISDLFDRYKVWSANVGAVHSGLRYKTSLDYRLREAPFYKSTVLKVLHRLRDILSTIKDLVANQNDADDVEPSPGGSYTEVHDEQFTDVDADWAISDSSSDSDFAYNRQASRAETERPPLRLVLGFDQKDRLEGSLDSLKFTITCLYKLPVRNLAPITRLKSSNQGIFSDSSLYQHFDVMFVQDLFPLCERQISIRLGRLITRRRYLLHYRQMHNMKLQHETAESSSAQALTINQPDSSVFGSESQMKQRIHAGSLVPAESSIVQTTIKASTFNPGRAPKVDIDLLSPAPLSEADTSTSIATTRTGQEMLPVPPRPKNSSGEELEDFECPYCGLAVHIRLNAHSWKKHLLQDIEPYVCVGTDCDKHESTYSNRDEWFEHQLQHFSQYHCGDPEHLPFHGTSGFQDHMSRIHKISLPVADLKSATAMFLRTVDHRSSLTCPLCKEETRQIKQHLSRHLERIALFAVPRIFTLDDEQDFQSGRANILRNLSDSSHSGNNSLSSLSEVKSIDLQEVHADNRAPVDKKLKHYTSSELLSDRFVTIGTFGELMEKGVIIRSESPEHFMIDDIFRFRRISTDRYAIFVQSKATEEFSYKHEFFLKHVLESERLGEPFTLGEVGFDPTQLIKLLRALSLNIDASNEFNHKDDLGKTKTEADISEIPDVEVGFSWDHVKPELAISSESKPEGDLNIGEQARDPLDWAEHQFLLSQLRFDDGDEESRNLIFDGSQRHIARSGSAHHLYSSTASQIHLFLLDNCFLLTTTESKQMGSMDLLNLFIVSTVIPMQLFQIRDRTNNRDKTQLEVARLGIHKIYTLQFADEYECLAWTNAIMKAKTHYAFKPLSRPTAQLKLELLAVTNRLVRLEDRIADPMQINGMPVEILMASQSEKLKSRAPQVDEEVESATRFRANDTEYLALGTKRGLYLLEHHEGKFLFVSHCHLIKRHANADEFLPTPIVHFITLEEVSGGILYLSEFSLYYLNVTDLDNIQKTVPTKLFSKHRVEVVRTAHMRDRSLVFYLVKEPLTTTCKILEPVMVKTSDRRSRFRSKYSGPEFKNYDEFYVPVHVKDIDVFNTTVAMATVQGFEVLVLDKKQPWSIPNLKADDASTQVHLTKISERIAHSTPYHMFRLSTSEFLCCYDDCAIYLNQLGEVSRSAIVEYVSRATAVAFSEDLLIIFHRDFIEIRNSQDGRLMQIIEGDDINLLDGGRSSTSPSIDKRASMTTVKFRMRCPGQNTKSLVLGLEIVRPDVETEAT